MHLPLVLLIALTATSSVTARALQPSSAPGPHPSLHTRQLRHPIPVIPPPPPPPPFPQPIITDVEPASDGSSPIIIDASPTLRSPPSSPGGGRRGAPRAGVRGSGRGPGGQRSASPRVGSKSAKARPRAGWARAGAPKGGVRRVKKGKAEMRAAARRGRQ
ncbi:uncharacterized protein H6S33_007009 [Morchella sextelata]|uniref:uncharacterized protein n=1 Tax=Morchella sextelata TaxID=1174677 RepID=UPI001D048CEE|nr:uncharacterized protein H6S33_007009 [Morchella sextelata]KAH0603978.1 hypothetical protein H6S33_007009 [Morchella sextelata]